MRALPQLVMWNVFAIALAYPAFALPAPATLSPQELYRSLSPSIWLVSTYDAAGKPLGSGSAVVVGPEALLTNCHVLRGASRVTITNDNVAHGARLQLADVERDLCQITARNLVAPAVQLGDSEQLEVGQRVFALGNPRGMERTLSDGLISALHRGEGTRELVAIQTSAPISPGSSGGGLFDAQGRLIGITSSGLRDSQNIGFAVPVNFYLELPVRGVAIAQVPAAPASAPSAAATAALYAGYWSGSFRCGAHMGKQPASYVNGWTVPVQMTVDNNRATTSRGDATYREDLRGTVAADGSVALIGQGAMNDATNYSWTARFQGRFAGRAQRFEASGTLTGPDGVVTRNCQMDLVKGKGASS